MTPLRLALFGAMLIATAPAFAQAIPGAPAAPQQPGPRGPGGMLRQFDTTGDGRVTWDEAWTVVQQRFAAADANHDGVVTLEEAQAFRPAQRRADAPPPRPERAERMARMFRALDANSDGRVTLEELRPAAEARFRAMDANGDRVVSADEMPQRHHRGPGGRGPGGAPPAAPAQPG